MRAFQYNSWMVLMLWDMNTKNDGLEHVISFQRGFFTFPQEKKHTPSLFEGPDGPLPNNSVYTRYNSTIPTYNAMYRRYFTPFIAGLWAYLLGWDFQQKCHRGKKKNICQNRNLSATYPRWMAIER